MLLKRYVLKAFLKSYLLVVGGLVTVFLVVDFFERVDEFVAKDLPAADILAYYIYKIPFVFFFMAPQAVLLATVISLASLARNNEFVAMKACGISVTGITFPIVGASLMIAFLVLACNEYVAPITNKKMNYIFYVKVRGKPTYGKMQQDKIWMKSKNGSIWNIDHYDPKQSAMEKVILLVIDNKGFIRQRIDAEKVMWANHRWEFMDGYVRTFNRDGLKTTEYFEQRSFPIPDVPEDFEKVRRRPEEVNLKEMYRAIEEQATAGKDTTKALVDFHHKISYPFISIVLGLLAIPLSLRSSRHGGILFCVGVNLAMGFVFSFLYAVGISLGHGGTFGPVLAAWGPIALFTAGGFYLILTLDSEKILPF